MMVNIDCQVMGPERDQLLGMSVRGYLGQVASGTEAHYQCWQDHSLLEGP